MACGKLND